MLHKQNQQMKQIKLSMHCRKYLQARIFKYLFLFLFSSANDCELDSDEGGAI